MLYEIPNKMRNAKTPDWPKDVGGIPAQLPDGTQIEIPVQKGVNVLVLGVVGTGKTKSYTLPAAKILLSSNPKMQAVFFEIKRSFIDYFLQPDDKVITHNSAAVSPSNLFRPCLIKEIRQATDKEAEMREIGEFLYAELMEGANQNRAWIASACNAFIGVLRVVVYCYPDENTDNWTLVNALRQMTIEELLTYLARCPRNHSMLRKDFGYDPDNPNNYQVTRRSSDIFFFFNQALEAFSGTFESKNGEDTIHDYLHEKYGRNLFFLYDLASAAISRPFMLYYLKKIKDYKMSNTADSSASMLWVMDEVDKMSDGGKTADFGLFQVANLGRETGIQIILATQSVENLFGLSKDFNEHITMGGYPGFPQILSFRPGDPTTIQMLQKLYGSEYRKHVILPVSRYDPPTVKYELEPAYTDMEFSELDVGDCIVKLKSSRPQKVHIVYDTH